MRFLRGGHRDRAAHAILQVRLDYHFLQLGGVRVRYLDRGIGPVILLLPSPLVLARSYASLLSALPANHRVLVPEMPGSGGSSRVLRPRSFEEQADWCARFLETLQVKKALVIGHSNSGPIAIHLAAARGDLVSAMALVGPVGARRHDTVAAIVARRAWDSFWEPGLSLRGWPHLLWNITAHGASFWSQVQLSAHTKMLDVAARVRVPVWLAWGKSDHTLPVADAPRYERALPLAHLTRSRGSHDWLITRPAAFVRALLDFEASAV